MNRLINNILSIFWPILAATQMLLISTVAAADRQIHVAKVNIPAYEYYKLPCAIELSPVEFELMKTILSNAVKDYNRHIPRRFKHMRIDQPIYGVQYKVKLDKNGNKIIEINAFAKKAGDDSEYKNLNSKEVIVFDGGSSFFNTIINLKTKKAERIGIHGLA